MSGDWIFPWTATLIREGERLPDGRVCEPGSIEWPDRPLPLFTCLRDDPIGRIDQVWREGDLIRASGFAARDLTGEGAAMEVEIKQWTLSSEIAPSEETEFALAKAMLRAVCVVAVPAYPAARFE